MEEHTGVVRPDVCLDGFSLIAATIDVKLCSNFLKVDVFYHAKYVLCDAKKTGIYQFEARTVDANIIVDVRNVWLKVAIEEKRLLDAKTLHMVDNLLTLPLAGRSMVIDESFHCSQYLIVKRIFL